MNRQKTKTRLAGGGFGKDKLKDSLVRFQICSHNRKTNVNRATLVSIPALLFVTIQIVRLAPRRRKLGMESTIDTSLVDPGEDFYKPLVLPNNESGRDYNRNIFLNFSQKEFT